jgi:hypothetical protein
MGAGNHATRPGLVARQLKDHRRNPVFTAGNRKYPLGSWPQESLAAVAAGAAA